MGELIDRNPDILGGTTVFSGTKVPVRILMEHLEAGARLDDFLHDYPTVSPDQAVELLELATTMLVEGERRPTRESRTKARKSLQGWARRPIVQLDAESSKPFGRLRAETNPRNGKGTPKPAKRLGPRA